MIKYVLAALSVCAFMSACQPQTKVYNRHIDQAPKVKQAPSYSSSKVGSGGYRYEGSRDSSSGFRASN
jgi:hypothetical protein